MLSKKEGQLIVLIRPTIVTQAMMSSCPVVGVRHSFTKQNSVSVKTVCSGVQTKASAKLSTRYSVPIRSFVYSYALVSKELLHVQSTMSRNNISMVAIKDYSILTYGDFLAHNEACYQFRHISQRMRLLAKLQDYIIIRLREKSGHPDADRVLS